MAIKSTAKPKKPKSPKKSEPKKPKSPKKSEPKIKTESYNDLHKKIIDLESKIDEIEKTMST